MPAQLVTTVAHSAVEFFERGNRLLFPPGERLLDVFDRLLFYPWHALELFKRLARSARGEPPGTGLGVGDLFRILPRWLGQPPGETLRETIDPRSLPAPQGVPRCPVQPRLLDLVVDLVQQGARRRGSQQASVAQVLVGLALDEEAPARDDLALLFIVKRDTLKLLVRRALGGDELRRAATR